MKNGAVKKWFKKLLDNETVFIILNTAFWLGLGYLLLSSPVRLIVGGGLLAIGIGGYVIYALAIADMAKGTAQPGLLRGWGISLGTITLVAGVFMLIYFFTGAVPTQRQIMQQRLEEARQGDSVLYLSDMGLREIPEEVWGLSHLTALYLDGNRLRVLPPEIARLENLQRLYLSYNRLESLPPDIGALGLLEWLDLDGNRLQSLPPEMARLQHLSHLKLQYNRFAAFPAVVLELPNLELLFLSGNRMGDLPPVILERAAQGDLNLWYQPRALRVDWASVSVIVLCFILPAGASWFVNRWWAAREQRQQQAASQEGLVYPIPSLFRQPALFVILTLAAVSTFVAIASYSGGMTKEAGWGIPLLFSPLMLGALALLLYNTGVVLLKNDGVAIRRCGAEHFLPWNAITAVRSRFGLRIEAANQVLRIPGTVQHLAALYAALLERISPTARQASLARSARTSDSGREPDGGVLRFCVSRRVWGLYIAGTLLFTAVYLGIGLMGLWIALARGDVPPFTWLWLRDTLIVFVIVSALFLPVLIWILRSFFTAYGPFQIRQPVALELFPQSLRYRFPLRPWQVRSVDELQRVWVESVPVEVRARTEGAILSQEVVHVMLLLEFGDSTRLVVGQERATQLNTSVEQLRELFKRMYGK